MCHETVDTIVVEGEELGDGSLVPPFEEVPLDDGGEGCPSGDDDSDDLEEL